MNSCQSFRLIPLGASIRCSKSRLGPRADALERVDYAARMWYPAGVVIDRRTVASIQKLKYYNRYYHI